VIVYSDLFSFALLLFAQCSHVV